MYVFGQTTQNKQSPKIERINLKNEEKWVRLNIDFDCYMIYPGV